MFAVNPIDKIFRQKNEKKISFNFIETDKNKHEIIKTKQFEQISKKKKFLEIFVYGKITLFFGSFLLKLY